MPLSGVLPFTKQMIFLSFGNFGDSRWFVERNAFSLELFIAQGNANFLHHQPSRQQCDSPEPEVNVYPADVTDDRNTVQAILEALVHYRIKVTCSKLTLTA